MQIIIRITILTLYIVFAGDFYVQLYVQTFIFGFRLEDVLPNIFFLFLLLAKKSKSSWFNQQIKRIVTDVRFGSCKCCHIEFHFRYINVTNISFDERSVQSPSIRPLKIISLLITEKQTKNGEHKLSKFNLLNVKNCLKSSLMLNYCTFRDSNTIYS